ncbi:hypothetical protein P67b_00009 [Ruegeria phage Tedan]|nr:hypothetical protein P67b_00009 [Ruegeria phage Tedan]
MSYLPDHVVRWIVQHYSATFIENEYTYEQLEADHKARGFREGGYHFYVTYPRPGKPARIIAGRDLTQPGRFEVGAHSKGENSESIGICCEGGLTKATGPNVGVDTRHPDQIKLQIELIDMLDARFPGEQIIEGHRDMPGAATQCPGYNARAWWDSVLQERANPKRPDLRGETAVAALIVAVGAAVTQFACKIPFLASLINSCGG